MERWKNLCDEGEHYCKTLLHQNNQVRGPVKEKEDYVYKKKLSDKKMNWTTKKSRRTSWGCRKEIFFPKLIQNIVVLSYTQIPKVKMIQHQVNKQMQYVGKIMKECSRNST